MKDIKAKIALLKGNGRSFYLVVLSGSVIFLLIIAFGLRYHLGAQEEIALKAEQYAVFSSLISRKDDILKRKEAAFEMIGSLEKGLLKAESPSMGAVMLEEAFKAFSARRGIKIVSEKALPPAEALAYIKVPVEFQLKAGTSGLKDLLLDIRSAPVLMGIRMMRIRSSGLSSSGLDVTLVIEGAIKKKKGD